ncbi:MAG: hypothetical protein EPO11_03400 [Gammaproteobacteria bacterium]|nr:MAG: hypothetical protein EPO11_03400 [Gammaproteobacteria bacterium]
MKKITFSTLLLCSMMSNSLASWTSDALKLQREIDLNAPFNETTFIATHNSYNSASYATPRRSYVDPNQLLSVYDQLNAGVRSIEYDAHWTMSEDEQHKDIMLCHGTDKNLGCSPFDRPIAEGLQELRDWLHANPNEIVLLYIERHLDGHESQLASELDTYLGDYIYKPNTTTCTAIPSSLTKAAVLRAGKQLLIVTKGCEADAPSWNQVVFAGIGEIASDPYSFIDANITDFTSYPDCGKSNIFYRDPDHTSLWRIYEDRTKLSNAVHTEKKLTDSEMQELMRCGINWPSMDMLSADDSRLTAAVWSWAMNYPQEGHGQCALYQAGEGMQNTSCNQTAVGYACQEENSHVLQAITAVGTWQQGEAFCQALAGKSWHFAVPVNGYQMGVLKDAMASMALSTVWLNYREDNTGKWTAA